MLDEILKAFDIFLISESKLDNTFLINQFSVRVYKVFIQDLSGLRWFYIIY